MLLKNGASQKKLKKAAVFLIRRNNQIYFFYYIIYFLCRFAPLNIHVSIRNTMYIFSQNLVQINQPINYIL